MNEFVLLYDESEDNECMLILRTCQLLLWLIRHGWKYKRIRIYQYRRKNGDD